MAVELPGAVARTIEPNTGATCTVELPGPFETPSAAELPGAVEVRSSVEPHSAVEIFDHGDVGARILEPSLDHVRHVHDALRPYGSQGSDCRGEFRP